MSRMQPLLDRYGESHRNPVNKAIHWICVPLITWSILAALWAWTPVAAFALVALALGFYVSLSPPLALGMLGVTLVLLAPLPYIHSGLLLAAAIVFVVAWIGQFVGHHLEGRKPSFLEDLKFLLVGPAWLLAFVYRRLRIGY